jgi:hypothetical protein
MTAIEIMVVEGAGRVKPARGPRMVKDGCSMKAPVPSWLKPLLVPVWNAGHGLVRRAGLYLRAIRNRRFARCDVCGAFGPMLYERRIIPARLEELWGLSPALAEAFARKESTSCTWCEASLRARRIARVLLDIVANGRSDKPAGSVAEWVRRPEARMLRIAGINRIQGLHTYLAALTGYSASEFSPGAVPGERVAGVRHEDLTQLTYDDESFDIVLTSETLEHVPDLDRALQEIHRVLVPGGHHLFTVPRLPEVQSTFARSTLTAEGVVVNHVPPIRHPGGDVGYLVFTEFGADLPDLVRRAGFNVAVAFDPPTEDDLAQVYVCRKIAESAAS